MKHTIKEESSILEVLEKLSPDSSKSTLRSWIKEGRVTVDGKEAKTANIVLVPGQRVLISPKRKFASGGIQILYDDPNLAVIVKPEGLLSVSTEKEKEHTAFSFLKDFYHPKKVHVVHRLDRETSGVMLFALNEEACENLKKDFEKHDIERCYYGIVEGRLKKKSGIWESYLYDDSNYVVHITDDPSKGKLAITKYRVEGESKNHSFVKFTLETGKKNQIRVQSSHAGHPLSGDKKYGAKGNILKRVCLHAYSLVFKHPVTGKKLRFTSPIPECFSKLVQPAKKEVVKL